MNRYARLVVVVIGFIVSSSGYKVILADNYWAFSSSEPILDSLENPLPTPSPSPLLPSPKTPPSAPAIDFANKKDGAADLNNVCLNNATLQAAQRRANATFVILARNGDLSGTIRSIRDIEDRFNRRYGYPYVFLNEEPFTEEFKRHISVLTSAPVEFGLIPREHWFPPGWVDEERARHGRERMEAQNIIYGGSLSYRNMCRFNSGFFFRHPLVQKYRWYWRIEPNVHFHCDINHDPFVYMEDHNKVYGFTITMYEYEATIPSLWPHVRHFLSQYPGFLAPNNSMEFISDDGGTTYNLCHFWSNFEIADMNFWRGPAYQTFFDFLDSTGNFYYERWGDAPVHSIAAALFASRDQLQFFDEIGYEHPPYTHCPKIGNNWEKGRCSCEPAKSFDYDGVSCMARWDNFIGE